jgi:hypothetical protein
MISQTEKNAPVLPFFKIGMDKKIKIKARDNFWGEGDVNGKKLINKKLEEL